MKLTLPNFSTNTQSTSTKMALPAQSEAKPHVASKLSKDTFQHSGAFTGVRILPERVTRLTPVAEHHRQTFVEKNDAKKDAAQSAIKEILNPVTSYVRIKSLTQQFGGSLTDLQKGILNQVLPGELKFEIKDPRFQVQAKEK
jgi:hypothetical protein